MKERLENLRKAAIEQLKEAGSLDRVEEIRINFLGKKNELANLMKEMGKLPSDIRPEMGKVANEVRTEIEDFIEKKKSEFKEILLNEKLEKESIDVTIPVEGRFVGKMHPITLGINEIEKILRTKGKLKRFSIEHNYFNTGKTEFADHKEYVYIVEVK